MGTEAGAEAAAAQQVWVSVVVVVECPRHGVPLGVASLVVAAEGEWRHVDGCDWVWRHHDASNAEE